MATSKSKSTSEDKATTSKATTSSPALGAPDEHRTVVDEDGKTKLEKVKTEAREDKAPQKDK